MRTALSVSGRRLVDASAAIRMEEPGDIRFQHIVLCHLGYPRSKTAARVFECSSGNKLLRLEAGALNDGKRWVEQPLPYGAIPRIIMIAAISHAVKHRTAEISLGRSMSESLRTLGLSDNGQAHWNRMQAQSKALAAVHMTIGYTAGGQARTVKADPVKQFTAWAEPRRDKRQLTLYPAVLTFSTDFYEELRGHTVPLDRRAVSAIAKDTLALDIYCWLAHRLYRVRDVGGELVSWPALQMQFGSPQGSPRRFRQWFRAALDRAAAVYPKADVDRVEEGLVLYRSPRPVVPVQVQGWRLGVEKAVD